MSRCSGHLLPPPPPPPPPPAPFAPPGPRREVVEKHKTRLCRFHEQGRCNKGSACTFAHSEADLRIGLATMQALHEFWMPYKTKPCYFWEKGKCQRGSMCTFAHCSGELPEAARHSEGSAGELSEEEQRPVKAAFDLFDTNGLGWLDHEDLKEAMQTLHHEPGEWEFHELFGNHAVRVRYEEFLKMMTHKIRGSVERRNDVSQARRSATGCAAEDETGRATPATDVASPLVVGAASAQSARENFLGTVRTGPRRGWFPRSHVTQFVCIQAPFDGRDYGHDYLILDEGAQVLPLEHPQADGWWAYGEQASGGTGEKRIQGWYPKKFEAMNTEIILEAMHYFDRGDFGEDYLVFTKGSRIRPLNDHVANDDWSYGELLSI